ncbi:MAG: hypothetical protein QG671_4015 [Actinomycetota bacterium]|nr:hypothetical protein [Actinomycetota bacterium]
MSQVVPERSVRRTRQASERFEFRVVAEQKQAIVAAAGLLGMPASDFAREVLTERAEEVLAEHEVKTIVSASYFEDLVAALDTPAEANSALRKAQELARQVVKTDHTYR